MADLPQWASLRRAAHARPVTARLSGWLALLAVVVALAGVAVSGYLVVENLRGETGICVGVHGCATVQNSRYGEWFGMPVSVLGFALYAFLGAAAVAWHSDLRGYRAELALAGFLGAFAGLLMSGYFTYLEAFVLDAWCSYCIASALLMTALFGAWSAILAITMRDG